jgi:hypothetical protein
MSPLEDSRRWVERVVVGLGLCPFASQPLMEERVRFALCASGELEAMLQALAEEIAWLDAADGPQTTLLILSEGVSSFDRFLDLVGAAEALVAALGKADVYQLAHFHPDYCFDAVDPDDPGNLTNRSPYPMLHLLRCADVALAIEEHPDTGQIPVRNIATLKAIGLEGVLALLR